MLGVLHCCHLGEAAVSWVLRFGAEAEAAEVRPVDQGGVGRRR